MRAEYGTRTTHCFRWEWLLPLGCWFCFVAFFAAIGITLYGFSISTDALNGAYAVDWATETMVTHLDDHPKSWPRSWDELKPAWDKRTAGCSPRYTFVELQELIEIPFDIDTALLDRAQRADIPPLVRLTSGKDYRFKGSDPTQRILDKWRGVEPLHPQ